MKLCLNIRKYYYYCGWLFAICLLWVFSSRNFIAVVHCAAYYSYRTRFTHPPAPSTRRMFPCRKLEKVYSVWPSLWERHRLVYWKAYVRCIYVYIRLHIATACRVNAFDWTFICRNECVDGREIGNLCLGRRYRDAMKKKFSTFYKVYGFEWD